MPQLKFTIQKANSEHILPIYNLIQFFSYKNALLPKNKLTIEKELISTYIALAQSGQTNISASPRLNTDDLKVNMSATSSNDLPKSVPISSAKLNYFPTNTKKNTDKIKSLILTKNPILGCITLKKYHENLFEVRSFAIWPEYQNLHIGSELIKCVKNSVQGTLFTLTFIPGYFIKYGFVKVLKESLPEKIYEDCLECNFLNDCNETALVYQINS